MKFYALFVFVVAVCAMLPSDGEARSIAAIQLRTVLRRAHLEVAKRQESEEEEDSVSESDYVTELLARYGVTMEQLDEGIANDEDIDPEDREAIKDIVIKIFAAFDGEDLSLSSSEELE